MQAASETVLRRRFVRPRMRVAGKVFNSHAPPGFTPGRPRYFGGAAGDWTFNFSGNLSSALLFIDTAGVSIFDLPVSSWPRYV